MNRLVIITSIVIAHAVVIGFMMFVGGDDPAESSRKADELVENNDVDEIRDELPDEDPVITDDADNGVSGPGEDGVVRHTIARGESLSVISQKYYNSAAYYLYIYEANQNVLSSPESVRVGQVLVIPPKPE